MYALVLDTATPAVVVGVVEMAGPSDDPAMPVTVQAARAPADARRHGEMLAPTVQAVLADAGVAVADLGAIVVGLGPGPFTGLRVGLVTAAALADAVGVPAYGVCSLDAIAPDGATLVVTDARRHEVYWAAYADGVRTHGPGPFTGLRVGLVTAAALADAVGVPAYGVCSLDAIAPDGATLVVTDARRHEVYWAAYADGVRTHGPGVARPEDLAIRIPALGVTACAGAAAEPNATVLGVPAIGPSYPDPQALAALAAPRVASGAPSEPLTPLYLRRPDATPPTHRKSAVPA